MKQRSRLTWNQQYSKMNPSERQDWDVNEEPDSLDLIWMSSALFGVPLHCCCSTGCSTQLNTPATTYSWLGNISITIHVSRQVLSGTASEDGTVIEISWQTICSGYLYHVLWCFSTTFILQVIIRLFRPSTWNYPANYSLFSLIVHWWERGLKVDY